MSKFYNTTISLNSDGTVPYDRAVALTPKQQATARNNISVPSSREVTELMASKQDKLVAGPGISIDPDSNIISATGGGGTAIFKAVYGTTTLAEVKAAINAGIVVEVDYANFTYKVCDFDGNHVSFENTAKAANQHVYTKYVSVTASGWSYDSVDLAKTSDLADKQDKLTAGDNITIVGNVISATGGGSGSDITVVNKNPSSQKGIKQGDTQCGRLIPEGLYTSENDGKAIVIKNYNGIYYTETASIGGGSGSGTFIATFDVTPFDDVAAAVDAGLSVYVKDQYTTDTEQFYLMPLTESSVDFPGTAQRNRHFVFSIIREINSKVYIRSISVWKANDTTYWREVPVPYGYSRLAKYSDIPAANNLKAGSHELEQTKALEASSTSVTLTPITLEVESISSGFIDFMFNVYVSDNTLGTDPVPAHLLIDKVFASSGTENLVSTTNFDLVHHPSCSPYMSGQYTLKLPINEAISSIELRLDTGIALAAGATVKLEVAYSYTGTV